MAKYAQWLELWGVCRECGDQFSLVLRARPDPKDAELLLAYLEPSRECRAEEGLLRHRCGGIVKVYGEDLPRIRLLG